MKIVMSEVTAAKTSIESSKTKLQSQINSAKSSWKGVVSSDGLSGSVKLAIDAEINNYQMPLLTNYYDAMHQLSTEFTKAISDFKSTVKETSGSAIIDTDALTTAESKFSDQLTKYTEIEAKFKTVYSSINDLVSVSEVSGSGFTEEMEKTKKVLTNTKTWMATFNGKKSSKAISIILSQQKAQIRSLKGVAGLSYTDPKSLEIYQNKAFKNKVSKQHKAVKEFEKKKLEAERAELLRKHPAILAIHGQIDKEYNAKIAREINDKNYKKTKPKKEQMVLVKETDSLEEVFRKYIYFSKQGIHPHTGKKISQKEAAKFTYASWSGSLTEVGGTVGEAYFGEKATKYHSNSAKKASGAGPSKTDFGAENPVSGKEWNNHFKDKYGAGKVQWKPTSFDDIVANPERLYGSTKNEIKSILGPEWTEGVYGRNGSGWKFTHPNGSVFYHGGGDIHKGSCYGFSTGKTKKVKVYKVEDGYIPTPDDGGTAIQID